MALGPLLAVNMPQLELPETDGHEQLSMWSEEYDLALPVDRSTAAGC
jgi:hypothetical protein